MSQFECSVKDLNGKQEEITEKNDNEGHKSILSRGKQKENVNKDVNLDVNSSLFAKISEEKNVRIILLVIIAYLITSSSQFTELLGNSFPYLVDSGVTNLSGKVVVAILIGLSVVLFTSFFQVP